jgi:hypothetical protein
MAFFKNMSGATQAEEAKRGEKLQNPQWGSWVYDPSTRTLLCKEQSYGIPLEEITDAAELLDWIFQVRGKEWATPQILAEFLEAIQFLLSPQAHFGSQGMSQPFDVKLHLERLNRRISEAV